MKHLIERLEEAADSPDDLVAKSFLKAKPKIEGLNAGRMSFGPERARDAEEVAYISYQFMSTWGAHDDAAWNRSAELSRGFILDELKKLGAKIGRKPKVDDFATEPTKFEIDGQKYLLKFDAFRYDLGLRAVRAK